MSKNVGKSISKNLSSKYSQNLLDYAKQFVTDVLKTVSKKSNSKHSKATSDLIENNIADKITRVSKILPNNNLETNEEEILRERFLPPELRYKTINDLRLKIH